VACVLLAAISIVLPLVPFKLEMTLTLVFVAAAIAWGARRKLSGEFDWFELFFIFAVLNLAYFGVGALWLKGNPEMLMSWSLRAYITPALVLGLIGFLSAFAGYATLGGRTAPARIGKFVPAGSTFYVVVAAIGAIGEVGSIAQERWMTFARAGISPIASTAQQFAPLFLYTWALLWLQFWAKALNRFQKLFLFLVVVPMSAIVLFGLFGAKELAIIFMTYPAIAYWYARRKMAWRALTVFVLIGVFVIFPLYNTFRNQSQDLAAQQRMSRAVDLAMRWDQQQYLRQSVTAFMQRISLVYCVGAILRDVPQAVPYKYGETLALLPIGLFVPRILWPDKPNITIGREFGVTFQLVNPLDETTQISPTITGELFWNYDLPGVIIGMFLIGGAMRYFYELFGAGIAMEPLRKACYLALLPFAIHFEGNVAGMLGAMIKSVLILALVFFVARRVGWIVEVQDQPSGATSAP
jgi:hypothetical protein